MLLPSNSVVHLSPHFLRMCLQLPRQLVRQSSLQSASQDLHLMLEKSEITSSMHIHNCSSVSVACSNKADNKLLALAMWTAVSGNTS